MIIGVDSRSNSVIVTGPEPLYRQVEALVRQIDQPGSTDTDVVSVVPIKVSDPELVQKTLNSILGANSRSGSRPSGGSSSLGRLQQRSQSGRYSAADGVLPATADRRRRTSRRVRRTSWRIRLVRRRRTIVRTVRTIMEREKGRAPEMADDI